MRDKPILLICVLMLGCICLSETGYSQKLQRVEPAFWWVGMTDPSLQVLVYGENIAALEPVIDVPGVTLKHTIKVQNPNYLFLDLTIDDRAQPGTFPIQFKRNRRTVTSFEYRLLQREIHSREREGIDGSDAIYLITPDRFANGNPGNDNMAGLKETADRSNPDGRHGGDIQGIADHLDYIKDLGFSAIWLNPVLENDMPQYSYHGYSTTDFYKVDPRFGTNEEYRQMAALAREKGVKLIMDIIVNHCGSEHWWMKDPPADDWINFSNEYVQTNHKKTTIQDPYVSQIDYRQFVDGWFVRTMPDLNQRNPLMANYLIQNSIWWIEYAHLAGIRQDTYPYPDKDFMTEWTCRIMQEYPDFYIVGEEWNGNPAIVAHWQRGKTNANGYTSCLPGVMDFPLQEALRKGLTEQEGWGSGWITTYEMLANDFQYADPTSLVIFPDNHDMDRFFTQVGENLDLFKMGLVYNLTMRGIPQIYYGTEVLMVNRDGGGHGVIRSDFPGGWSGDAYDAKTGVGLGAEQKDAQAFVKNLLNWRKKTEVVHYGSVLHYVPENGIYVYFRYDSQDRVMVILNKNDQQVELELARFAEGLQNATRARDVIRDMSLDLGDKLTVPSRSPLILELN